MAVLAQKQSHDITDANNERPSHILIQIENKKAAEAEAPAAQESPATTDESRYQRAAPSGSWLPSSRR
jgi:hypothetical protein